MRNLLAALLIALVMGAFFALHRLYESIDQAVKEIHT